jgi:predicted transcriptional regulator
MIAVGEGDPVDSEDDIEVKRLVQFVSSSSIDVSLDEIKQHFSWARSTAYGHVKRAKNLGLITRNGKAYGPAQK